MTVQEFAANEIRMMEDFRDWWADRNKELPENYSNDYDETKWTKEFYIWRYTKDLMDDTTTTYNERRIMGSILKHASKLGW